MSLDLYLEADNALTAPTLGKALSNAGAWEINVVGDSLESTFISGLTLSTDGVTTDSTIYAEDTKGIDFRVAMRCTIRIKGPEPEGQSAMEDLDKIAQSIAKTCSSLFLISFQLEETLYWRDAAGLHRPGCQSLQKQ
ncbi:MULTISPECIES: hypothetical protein [unclassified Pseudomonas]|uniref:hypothetical protein n=1 Tax=unclassified Pseudomonas TaxID=196821 RepID=UPI000270B456|nr:MULTISPECIES: hypothetical protein [unclassified Pseudomonas]EJM88949.1 hypothetical protein PMI33_02414 [Pseudomonas sp. GM67]MBD9550107.1 hypothetical protein [Pseudomonas sp. PDM01]